MGACDYQCTLNRTQCEGARRRRARGRCPRKTEWLGGGLARGGDEQWSGVGVGAVGWRNGCQVAARQPMVREPPPSTRSAGAGYWCAAAFPFAAGGRTQRAMSRSPHLLPAQCAPPHLPTPVLPPSLTNHECNPPCPPSSLAGPDPIVPFRTNALTTARIPDFVAAGFDEAAVRSYMSVVNATVNHPNLAPGPIIPRGDMLRALMGVAAANLSAGMEAAEVAAGLQAQVRGVRGARGRLGGGWEAAGRRGEGKGQHARAAV